MPLAVRVSITFRTVLEQKSLEQFHGPRVGHPALASSRYQREYGEYRAGRERPVLDVGNDSHAPRVWVVGKAADVYPPPCSSDAAERQQPAEQHVFQQHLLVEAPLCVVVALGFIRVGAFDLRQDTARRMGQPQALRVGVRPDDDTGPRHGRGVSVNADRRKMPRLYKPRGRCQLGILRYFNGEDRFARRFPDSEVAARQPCQKVSNEGTVSHLLPHGIAVLDFMRQVLDAPAACQNALETEGEAASHSRIGNCLRPDG